MPLAKQKRGLTLPDYFKRHNLGPLMYFNKKVFGEDKIVKRPFCDYPGFIEGLMRPTLPIDEAVGETLLGEKATNNNCES